MSPFIWIENTKEAQTIVVIIQVFYFCLLKLYDNKILKHIILWLFLCTAHVYIAFNTKTTSENCFLYKTDGFVPPL